MQLLKTLGIMAELNQVTLSKEALACLVMELTENNTENEILHALKKCRYELNHFPRISEIMQRIPNGHPTANEAWALCPKDEGDSVCWTKEIEKAYFIAYDLSDDRIQMRLAFIEAYNRLLGDAIRNKTYVEWNLSLGHDIAGRERCILENVEQGKLSSSRLCLLPEKTEINIINQIEEKLKCNLIKVI